MKKEKSKEGDIKTRTENKETVTLNKLITV